MVYLSLEYCYKIPFNWENWICKPVFGWGIDLNKLLEDIYTLLIPH